MDPHRLSEERSLAYHRVIAERLLRDARILQAARQRVERWLTDSPPAYHALRWREILAGDPIAVVAFLCERSELAAELRQSSPFAGALAPRERWQIWRATRDAVSRPS
jgi:hypothetical protein